MHWHVTKTTLKWLNPLIIACHQLLLEYTMKIAWYLRVNDIRIAMHSATMNIQFKVIRHWSNSGAYKFKVIIIALQAH